MMGPFELGAIALLLSRMGKDGAGAGGWRQLGPTSKSQYQVPAGATFALDVDASSPQAPILTKQLQDAGGTVLPPNVTVVQMPIDWPPDDETRTTTGRMRAYGKFAMAQALSLGLFSGATQFPVRVWVK